MAAQTGEKKVWNHLAAPLLLQQFLDHNVEHVNTIWNIYWKQYNTIQYNKIQYNTIY